jgi:NADH dehydrogenase [ubiquinone] 1 alpha subcomplex assembly factor 7
MSPHLSQLQAQTLCVKTARSSEPTQLYYQLGTTATNIPVFWYSSIQDVPRHFSCFLANEFFDALPIHKFQVRDCALLYMDFELFCIISEGYANYFNYCF